MKRLTTALLGLLFLPGAFADSLLAPWVVSARGPLGSGIETFLSMKFEGRALPNYQWGGLSPPTEASQVHYRWYRWINVADDGIPESEEGTHVCEESNAVGNVSPWDMVFQAVGSVLGNDLGFQLPLLDRSDPRFFLHEPGDNFRGFMIIDDEIGGQSITTEGNFSGFAYVVDFETGTVLDYKLLNNHRSTASGDFSAQFISKLAVDFSWWPINVVDTAWLVLVVGPDMSDADWPGTIIINSEPQADANVDTGDPRFPTGGINGVYDHDEQVYSGDELVEVVCLDILTRDDLLTSQQEIQTRNGGWARRDELVLTNPISASGAIVYKIEQGRLFEQRLASFSFQVETSGHWGNNRGPRDAIVNRPY